MARKIKNSMDESQCQLWRALSYTPYGYCSGCSQLIAFNGEREDPVTGHYLLGNGHRGLNPVLMRFNSPDSMSPFGRGGTNSYCYCLGGPINLRDPSGRFPVPTFLSRFFRWAGLKAGFIKEAKGAGRLFNAVTTSQTKIYTRETRARSAAAPSLASSAPGVEDISDWDYLGAHGSSKEHGPSLMSGLDPAFQGSSHAQLFGKGFYLAPDPYHPFMYARSLWMRGKTPELYGVYIKYASRLKLGRDYSIRVREGVAEMRRNLEIVIREPAYHLIAVRSGIRDSVVLLRPNEAPF